MVYSQPVIKGTFISRPNRFIAICRINGVDERCHVKNTGRCKELLTPNCTVLLTCHDDLGRSTKYSVVAVYKGDLLINMDSQAPNTAAWEYLQSGDLLGFVPAFAKREVTYKDARFDMMAQDERGHKTYIEVKGVTLEEGGHARFPDAPTERGIKHIRHLMDAAENGHNGVILFVLQFSEGKSLAPNDETHPAFGDALREAAAAGVKILAVDCTVTENSMICRKEVPVCLNR